MNYNFQVISIFNNKNPKIAIVLFFLLNDVLISLCSKFYVRVFTNRQPYWFDWIKFIWRERLAIRPFKAPFNEIRIPSINLFAMPGEDKPESKTPEKSTVLKEKLIRFFTVCAYASSVSMAAMCLTSYYIFFWEPKPAGPGPPVLHPHAYVADPYPPLKLVGLPPDGQDAEGASFWQSEYNSCK